MAARLEVLLAQAVQDAAPELRIAADAVMRVGLKITGGGVQPALFRPIPLLHPDDARIPIVDVPGNGAAALEHEDPPSSRRERAGHRATTRAAADDDDVVMRLNCATIPDAV